MSEVQEIKIKIITENDKSQYDVQFTPNTVNPDIVVEVLEDIIAKLQKVKDETTN